MVYAGICWNRFAKRDGNLGFQRGRSALKEEDEAIRPTLPKKGVEERGIGGGLPIGTERQVVGKRWYFVIGCR